MTDWTFWAAAASKNSTFNDLVITAVHDFISNGKNTEPFGTKYVVDSDDGRTIGQWLGNRARPTVGSNFALLAIEQGYWGSLYSGWKQGGNVAAAGIPLHPGDVRNLELK